MPQRRIDSRLFLLASMCIVWVLAGVGSSLLPTAASAGPLEDVTGQVNEVTAPLQEAVQQVVPPVTAPPPAPAPPPVPLPKVKVPAAPVKPPPVRLPQAPVKIPPPSAATAANIVEGATKTATSSAGTAASSGQAAVNETQSAVGAVTDATQQTAESATAEAETVLDATATAAAARTTGRQDASGGSTAARPFVESSSALPADAGATAAPDDFSSMVFPGIPARLLSPFIRVWPAVALVTEGPLGAFFGNWSRSVLALFEENRTGSLPGEGEGALSEPLTAPPPTAPSAQQPPFSWFASPARTPFNWVGNESALVVLALFLIAGASALLMLALGRREVGLPMFRRGNRFPWRH